MEKELASRIFMLEDYNNKENMEKIIEEYIKKQLSKSNYN